MGELEDKIKQLNDLKSERIPRPSTKKEYAALLRKLESDIAKLTDKLNAEADKIRAAAEKEQNKRNESVIPMSRRLAALELAALEIREMIK